MTETHLTARPRPGESSISISAKGEIVLTGWDFQGGTLGSTYPCVCAVLQWLIAEFDVVKRSHGPLLLYNNTMNLPEELWEVNRKGGWSDQNPSNR